MSQNISTYTNEVSEKYKTGRAGEHAYRPTFEKLIKSLDQKLEVINDPKRTEYGAPDFIFVRGELIAGYAETKDIDADLDKVEKTEQVERYLGYSNLILTNYLEFRFFRNGERYGESIVIGKIKDSRIHIQEESISLLENAITDFFTAKPEAIKSGTRLARIMGGKARRIRDNVKKFLAMESGNNKELARVYETIKELLVHDLTTESFADMYAQTLVYGLFVARYYDDSPANFTRQRAGGLIPASNPFLRHFFDHIAGIDFDQRLAYIVGELCEVFRVADVQQLMSQYFQKDLWGEETSGPDPVIHFYEDFLKEYDADLRKKMGAYYTPLPVVRFIVRSVDTLLQKEFKLFNGLADTTKIGSVHKVQILDPAVGTGTFLSETIQTIYQKFSAQGGRWAAYVHHDLLPRLYGFELMMAPYTIAHLKISMKLAETGFTIFNKGKRLGIYLTNSLEEKVTQADLFSLGIEQSIAEESKEAAVIKNETPIMVVIGNPPYSAISSNKAANYLVEKYKVEPGGTTRLKERKNWLDDDYVKFISLAENFVEKNGKGILAYITNNGFIDNPTFRGMRWHLLKTFDDIYIVNLHGSAEKDKKSLNGGKDENVFNIMQGVSINIFIKKKQNKKDGDLGNVYYSDLYGTRESKFDFLNQNNLETIEWDQLKYTEPYFFFAPKDFKGKDDYEQGFSVVDMFGKNATGIVTMGDEFIITQNKKELEDRLNKLLFDNISEVALKSQYHLGKNYAKWILENKKGNKIIINENKYTQINYRPFDIKWTYYDKNLVWRCRDEVMNNFLAEENIGLALCKQFKTGADYFHCFISNKIIESSYVSNRTSEITSLFPLYLFSSDGTKTPNFKKEIVDGIEKNVGKTTPENIFDYIYAVLHSPSYREKYKEFLKIDFPRVPYPKDARNFRGLVTLGAELRSLHLLESPRVNQFITTYSVAGLNVVEKLAYKDGKVFINKDQYFGNVPESAWNFYIGGYQPAQKWLKDRKSRTLTNEDIEHYQKMIVALVETDRIMREIENLMK